MLTTTLMSTLLLTAWPPREDATGYLFHSHIKADKQIDWDKEAYKPRPGDLLLFDDHSPVLTRIYKLVGTDGPLHAAIVFKRADGTCTTLEAGAHMVPRVQLFDVEKRLHDYPGTVLVRRLKEPLSAEHSQKLTEFALAQEGKSYAVLRLMLQGTPLRPRGWLNPYIGKTALDRDRWICSELVTAAATAAGVLDAKSLHANAVFPRDLCYDETVNLSSWYTPPALWYPQPNLEFVGSGVRVMPGKK